jgi:NADH:ubiquinone oxidoreductase subunit E
MAEIAEIINDKIKHFGRERVALLPILQGIVKEKNFVNNQDMVQIAEALDISAADVFGTASFYSFIDHVERGKYVIRVCKSITCEMKGKHKVLQALEDELRIKLGETTHDKKFSLLQSNCLGLCDQGPAMLINEEAYTHLNPVKVHEIINHFRNLSK